MEHVQTPSGTDIEGARTAYGRPPLRGRGGPPRGRGRVVDGPQWHALHRLQPGPPPRSRLADVVPSVLEAVGEARAPALVMLAGAGLAAADALAEAGWVCTGTQPFMARAAGPAVDDPEVRALGPEDLAAGPRPGRRGLRRARRGGGRGLLRAGARPTDTRAWGLFEHGVLRCCSFTVWVDGAYNVGWALATATEHQRSGYGRPPAGLEPLPAPPRRPPPVALCTASPAGERLYHEEGYTTLEHWQLWSRPRWVLRWSRGTVPAARPPSSRA